MKRLFCIPYFIFAIVFAMVASYAEFALMDIWYGGGCFAIGFVGGILCLIAGIAILIFGE